VARPGRVLAARQRAPFLRQGRARWQQRQVGREPRRQVEHGVPFAGQEETRRRPLRRHRAQRPRQQLRPHRPRRRGEQALAPDAVQYRPADLLDRDHVGGVHGRRLLGGAEDLQPGREPVVDDAEERLQFDPHGVEQGCVGPVPAPRRGGPLPGRAGFGDLPLDEPMGVVEHAARRRCLGLRQRGRAGQRLRRVRQEGCGHQHQSE